MTIHSHSHAADPHSHHGPHVHGLPEGYEAGVSRALKLGIAMNVAYALAECAIGLWQGSMGLIADAGHNLSDVAGLVLALLAVKLVRKRATPRYTFGYKKASILISLLNALILMAAVAGIVWESVEKFLHPQPVSGWVVAATAAVGVAVNFLSARLLTVGKERDLNVKGAYLHMVLDALVSVGVVVSGAVISLTGWTAADPVVGIVIAAVIVWSSWHLLAASLRLALDGVPDHVDTGALCSAMKRVEGVADVHHLHVWALSTTQTALTAHVVVEELARWEEVRRQVHEVLREQGIAHVTLEAETSRTCDCDCR